MSKKRKAQDTNLPVQSRPSQTPVSAAAALSTAPLSAFAAARAKAAVSSSDPVVRQPADAVVEVVSFETATTTTKKSKIVNPSEPRSKVRRKDRHDRSNQDLAIDTEDVFSQLPSLSRHPMPEPYKVPDHGSDDLTSEAEAAETSFSDSSDEDRIVQMSSWSPTRTNCTPSGTKGERITMSNGQTLSILGHYQLQVREGVIVIAGTFLAPGSSAVEIYAPSTSSIPVIKCIKFEGAVIEISDLPSDEESVDILQRLSPLYSSEPNAISARATDSQPSFLKILGSQELSKGGSVLPLDIPKAWQECINGLCSSKMNSAHIVQLCGPANVGKSTFATILMNSLLTSPGAFRKSRSVAYLDLDQNKQEYGPPGQISLVLVRHPNLKPRFARSVFSDGENRVVKAHAIRLNGHKEDMEHYLHAVCDLVQQYHSLTSDSAHAVPLIANCPFWYQASGYDLTVNLTEALKPSHVLCFASGPTKVLHRVQKSAGSTLIENLPAQPFLTASKSPRTTSEINEMHILSYFHAESGETTKGAWNPSPLAHQRPFNVSYAEKSSEYAGVFIFGEVPVMYPNMLATLLNGSVVSLLAIDDPSAFENRSVLRGEDDGIPYFTVGARGYTVPFDPRKSRVIGLGLIRGIDTKAQVMQILTPVPARQIAEVPWDRLVLALGALESPGWAYLEEKYYHDWANGQGWTPTVSSETTPWVEDAAGERDGKQSGGLKMQVWKTRRFQ